MPAHRIVREGIGHVLERRRLFPYLTVRQNVQLGAYAVGARNGREEQLAHLTELFPIIKARADQQARTLSGGEQQMVAMAAVGPVVVEGKAGAQVAPDRANGAAQIPGRVLHRDPGRSADEEQQSPLPR